MIKIFKNYIIITGAFKLFGWNDYRWKVYLFPTIGICAHWNRAFTFKEEPSVSVCFEWICWGAYISVTKVTHPEDMRYKAPGWFGG